MNIADLIVELDKYPKEAKVKITWEGIFQDVRPSDIFRAPTGEVIINAEENISKKHTKSEIMSGKLKPY